MRTLAIIAVVALVIVVLFFSGWLLIWCLNTLFSVGIAYTMKTGVAAAVLLAFMGAASNSANRS